MSVVAIFIPDLKESERSEDLYRNEKYEEKRRTGQENINFLFLPLRSEVYLSIVLFFVFRSDSPFLMWIFHRHACVVAYSPTAEISY